MTQGPAGPAVVGQDQGRDDRTTGSHAPRDQVLHFAFPAREMTRLVAFSCCL